MAIALFTNSPDAVSRFIDLELSNGKRLSVFGTRDQDESFAICMAPFANQVNSTYAAWIRAKLRRLVYNEYDNAKAIEAIRLPRFCTPARITLDRIRRANSGGFPIEIMGAAPGELQEGDTVIASPMRYHDASITLGEIVRIS